MTTDPPPAELEDVRIDSFQTRLPSAVCTNKEIFDEVFSLETWKTVLQPDQRDRILKMLPPEVLKIPGAAEKTIEDLFSKQIVSFGTNPLDTLFDKLINGHCDPVVAETKNNIVREWRRESLRLKKHYHTKLLQDIVISREKHLRKLVPISPLHKKNGKKGGNATTVNATNGAKKNGKPSTIVSFTATSNGTATTNGVPPASGGKASKNNQQALKVENVGSSTVTTATGKNLKPAEVSRNKRGRLEAALLSPPTPASDCSSEGPATKKSKQSTSKAKSNTSKKAKEQQQIIVVTTSQPSPSTTTSPSSQPFNSPSTLGNGSGSVGANQKTPLLLGSLTAGKTNEAAILSLCSPSANTPSPPTSLLESLTSPINPPTPTLSFSGSDVTATGTLAKQYTKVYPSPLITPSPVSTSQSPSYLPSPVQSSPILASQLQAPSPISVNLSSITGIGGITSRSTGGTGSPSHSSITLNYTQAPLAPPPAATVTSQQHHNQNKGILDDESSDEFEFETIEPTIGFSGPSTAVSTTTTGTLKSMMSIPAPMQTLEYKKSTASTITTQELANIQKCSLLTNCLTQPLPPNSSSAAAVSAALANNILASTPVTVTQSGGVHQIHLQQQQPQKLIVTSGGLVSTSSGIVSQQLQKFLSTPQPPSSTLSTAQKMLTQQQLGFFQQQLNERNIISATSQPSAVDAQTLVNSIMASKDLLATFGASGTGTSASSLLHHIQQQSTSQLQSSQNILPISVNLQSGTMQQAQLKQATFIRASPSLGTTGLLQAPAHGIGGGVTHQLVSLSPQTQTSQSVVIGQSSTLNTQSLQLPSSILSSGGSNMGISSAAKIISSSASSSSIPNLLDSDDLNLNLGSFTMAGLAGMNLDMSGVALSDIDTSGISGVVGGPVGVDSIKLEMDCAIDKMDDLSGVLDGNPFDSIPNLSDELDGLDLDMVDGLCDFEVLLSEEKQYASFFSLIRDVLCSTRDHRMTLVCMEKTIRKWQISPGAGLNPWYMRVHDWNSALIVALNFLAGNYQDVHPEDFVPYIEYKYKTKYYQWIGAGRDGDNNLSPLCNLWMDNLDRLPPLKKSEADGEEPEESEDDNEDSDAAGGGDSSDAKKKNKRPQTPPPPRCTTDWTVRPSTLDEKEEFRQQEKCRFDNPHKAFTYRMHGYESVVGPVKGVYSSQTGVTNKARGHSLLVDDRPPYVTILALVRDAVARLPNGEGTRSEICEMLRDSAFLAPEASNVTLNSVVSGALDRLHYEKDPCTRYDSHKKSWIYLHRDRTQEQFERLHHNRSYTKSTKSRNSSSRKSRKGSSKSSTSSVSSVTGIRTTNPPQSSSSSSSQSSVSTVETSQSSFGGINTSTTVATIVGVGSGAGGVVSTSTGGSVVTLPPLSTINPKMSTIITPPVSGSMSAQHSQALKQAIGLMSVTSSGGIQTQQQGTAFPGTLQSISSIGNSRGMVTLSGGGQDIIHQTQGSGTPSLNEILSAAAGLRFQTSSGGGTPMLLNHNMLGQQQQGKQQQTAFLQDSSGQNTTARLVLQQQTQHGTAVQQQTQSTIQEQTSGLQIQQQGQQLAPGSQSGGIAPGQILLGSSAAVLKLAGNIRLGEGLRLAQLRLPTGGAATGPGNSLAAATSPLRLPQHRILLTRGALPGQPQTQGVLLGQTSTGQTVILSAGPAGSGSLAGLQALSSGGSAATGQIAVHTPAQSLENSPTTIHQQQAGFGQQQSLQTFATNQGTTKLGIITNASPNTNTIMVSSGPTTTVHQGTTVTYTNTPRVQQQQSLIPSTQGSTLPPTSISLPASILAPAQSSSAGTMSVQTPPSNITVSTGHHPQSHQQQFILTGSGGTTAQQQSQSSTHKVSSSGGTSTMQLQTSALSQAVQSLQQHQNLMLTSTSQQQGSTSQHSGGQSQHQLAAPFIIRSAQGDFVSFGIPSHLSLGRGMQGIKVIPFQAGKQTVLARIVPPPSQTSGSGNGNGATVGMTLTGSSAPGTTLSPSCSNANVIVTSSGSLATFANPTGSLQAMNSATALVSGMSLPAQQQTPTLTTLNNNGTGGGVVTMVSGSSIVNPQSSSVVTVCSNTSSST